VAVIALAIAPLFVSAGGDVLNNMVLAAAYVVMALGLNIIVGFAGPVDLGYVAFYALGAMVVGWWASGFFTGAGGAEDGIHIRGTGAFDLSAISSGIYGAILVVVMLFRPHRLVAVGAAPSRSRPDGARARRKRSRTGHLPPHRGSDGRRSGRSQSQNQRAHGQQEERDRGGDVPVAGAKVGDEGTDEEQDEAD